MLDTDFIKCIKSAQEKDDMNLVKKENALKRKSEETNLELDILLNGGQEFKWKEKKASPSVKPYYFKPSTFLFIVVLD